VIDKYSFNLITEPFIPVSNEKNEIEYHSLQSIFENSGRLKRICHTDPMVSLALYRLLIVILVRSGAVTEDNWQDAFEGEPLIEDINKYLSLYKERFDLFDTEKPFMQVPQKVSEEWDAVFAAAKPAKPEKTNPLKPIHVLSYVQSTSSCFFTRANNILPESINFQEAACQLIKYQLTSVYTGGQEAGGGHSQFNETGRSAWFINGNNLWESLLLNICGFIKKITNEKTVDCASWEIDLPDINEIVGHTAGICHCFSWISKWMRLVPDSKGVSWVYVKGGSKCTWNYEIPDDNPMTAYTEGAKKDEVTGEKRPVSDFVRTSDRKMWKNYYTFYSRGKHCRCENIILATDAIDAIKSISKKVYLLDISVYILEKGPIKSKIDQIREEHFPLYLSLFKDDSICEFLEECILNADEVGKILLRVINTVFNKKKESRLQLYTDQYWSLSEDYFWEMLDELSRDIEEDNILEVKDRWCNYLVKSARIAFNEFIDHLPINIMTMNSLYGNEGDDSGQARKFNSRLITFLKKKGNNNADE
jgi:CRISPR system Cascade subunit CasA